MDDSLYSNITQINKAEGIDVYLKYSYNVVLFFVKIDAFHNTTKNILKNKLFYSQIK
jgi:hypothetical protein